MMAGSDQVENDLEQLTIYLVPEAAGSGVLGLAGSSQSILQLGRALWRAATAARVTFVPLIFRDFRLLQSSSGDRFDTLVPPQVNSISGIPCAGDKSNIFEPVQYKFVRGIPFRGDRSATSV